MQRPPAAPNTAPAILRRRRSAAARTRRGLSRRARRCDLDHQPRDANQSSPSSPAACSTRSLSSSSATALGSVAPTRPSPAIITGAYESTGAGPTRAGYFRPPMAATRRRNDPRQYDGACRRVVAASTGHSPLFTGWHGHAASWSPSGLLRTPSCSTSAAEMAFSRLMSAVTDTSASTCRFSRSRWRLGTVSNPYRPD